jgi:hypothetical protein
MFEKLKSLILDDAVFNTCIVILVAAASFGLGRLSVLETDQVPQPGAAAASTLVATEGLVKLDTPPSSTTVATSSPDTPPLTKETAAFVASKSGTKYHKLTCPGAKQIKPENQIFFATTKEAEAAGYTPAANCPGL